ncbi:class B sortase [Peptoniphilus sp. KCTC 25270]|uniref:class B sortase n=1 Tax=Peptoniphilus sp. KCTC 25270 TaxID=2897414 RepID=UPI001E468DFD|nr:class B sortase [Peptoniphilus sp. KCTC 25270]MCD1146549.1 class B sortase [Peptoniphilus sp. KCTC 25270]
MKDYFKKILVVVLVIVAVFSIYQIGDYIAINVRFDEELEEIQTQKTEETAIPSTVQKISKKPDEMSPNEAERIRRLQALYPDLVGWITIVGTEIDFPLMYSENNYFYLDHNYKGEYHPFGTPYIDAGNRTDFTDQNTVIYGHNVRSGKVFHDLTQYMDKEFVEKASEICISTSQGVLRYEIFAAYVADPYDNFRSPTYEGEAKATFLAEIGEKNLLDKDVPKDVKNFLTLQTCLDDNKRLVIHGKIQTNL